MAVLVLLLLGQAPVFDTFEAPPDAQRWYIGAPAEPAKGALRLPRDCWMAARGHGEEGQVRIEIDFRHRGGALELTFHDPREPLSDPQGEPIRVSRGRGERALVAGPDGVQVDGEALSWKGRVRGSFRVAARGGDLELLEVRVEPAPSFEPRPGPVRVVHEATTPLHYREGEQAYSRVSLLLWDAEVCFLFRRGEPSFALLKGPAERAPVLGAIVRGGEGKTLARRAASHPLARRDWGDESRNLPAARFQQYLAEEYALFALLRDAQRALNATLPERDDLEPLAWLAVIRHSANAHAAVALAETEKAKGALDALREALGKGADPARASADQLRSAAGAAAKAILGEPPDRWPGFRFDPMSRFVTIEQARELVR